MNGSPIVTQFHVTDKGMVEFLSGKMVEGIGPVYARRLVERFGTEALNVLLNEPGRAEEVPGLGRATIERAADSVRNIKEPIPLIIFLYSCGVSDVYVARILAKYGKRAEEVVTTDPYAMVEEVWQLSFFTADKIGHALGIAADAPERLQGALVTAVKHYASAGHLFATPEQAVAYASEITGVSPDRVKEQIEGTVSSGRLVYSRGGLYLPVFYKAEKEGAQKLVALASATPEGVDMADLPTTTAGGEPYSPAQMRAIREGLTAPVMVLTGGPGTGKTTVLRGIIEALRREGRRVVLAAPTGRAAKRMSMLTGAEASTIHRLLGYRDGEGYSRRQIPADTLIIDEGSMMEQVLFNHLLQSLRPGTHVIIVGDVDQLPAIGAGDVLRDLIRSGRVPVMHLDENFRHGEGSLIASGARAINEGRVPESDPERDFIIIPEPTPKAIHAKIISLMTKELPESQHISPSEIIVVTPQQIGPLGARQLNVDLQARLNPEGPEVRRGSTIMRLGDR